MVDVFGIADSPMAQCKISLKNIVAANFSSLLF